MESQGKFNEPIDIDRLLKDGVESGQILELERGTKVPAKYKTPLNQLMTDTAYQDIAKEISKLTSEWDADDSVPRSSKYFSIAEVAAVLCGIKRQEIEDFIEMALERRQLHREDETSFSIPESKSVSSGVEDLRNASPALSALHEDHTFGNSDEQKVTTNKAIVPCNFFGCTYVGSASNLTHHYVS